jgi:hypothetical protein
MRRSNKAAGPPDHHLCSPGSTHVLPVPSISGIMHKKYVIMAVMHNLSTVSRCLVGKRVDAGDTVRTI